MLDSIMKTRSKGTVDSTLRRKPPRGHPNRDLDQLTKRTATEVAKTPNDKERRPKTPKSKRKSITPLRDELICSQQFDSQVVVGWDCHSPNSIRDIRRSRSEDDPTDLISRLINDEPEEIIAKRSTPPLLAMWKGGDREETQANTLIPNRLKKRERKRRKSAKDTVSQALLQKLEKALDKCSETNKETEPRNAEGELFPSDIDEEGEDEEDEEEEMMVINTSEDLFDSTANPASVLRGDTAQNLETGLKDDSNPKPTSGRLSATGVKHGFALNHQRGYTAKNQASVLKDDTNPKATTCVLKDTKAEAAVAKEDDDWSDDDLFDDSFIIKPTQLSVDTKKSQVFGLKRKPFRDSDLPQSKCFRASERQAIGRFGHTAATSSATVTTGSNRFSAAGIRPAVNSADSKASTGLVGAHACTRTRQLQTKSVPTATVSSSVASGIVTRGSSLQTTGYKQQNGCVSVTEKPSSSFYGKNKVPSYTNSVSQSNPTSVMNASVMRSSSGYKNSPAYPAQTGLQSNKTYGATGSDQVVNQSTQNRVSAFKKHSSFSGTESVNQLRTSARKRSISGNSNSPTCSSTVVNSTVTKAGSFQAGSAQTANSSFQGQTKPSFSTYQKTSAAASKPHTVTSASSSYVDGGNSRSTLRSSTRAPTLSSGAFDTSLSDDLLCQLAEPDDILDSQIEPTKRLNQPRSVAGVGSSSYTKPSVFSKNTSSTSMSVKALKPEVPVAQCTAVKAEAFSFDSSASGNRTTAVASTAGPACVPGNRTTAVASTAVPGNRTIAVASTAGPAGAPDNRTTGAASTAGPAKQYRFRDSQKSRTSKSPPQPPKPAQTPATFSKAQVPVAAGPVQSVQSKNATSGEKVVTKAEEDLLLAGLDDDAFDDEFSDDEGLTEPTILAMLDEAEFLATQQCASQRSNSDMITNSQDQVSNSQGVAGSSQGHIPNSQGQTSCSQDHLFNSPGHTSNSQGQGQVPNSPVSASQTKYTAIDIERKKREALERKKLKTQLRNTQAS